VIADFSLTVLSLLVFSLSVTDCSGLIRYISSPAVMVVLSPPTTPPSLCMQDPNYVPMAGQTCEKSAPVVRATQWSLLPTVQGDITDGSNAVDYSTALLQLLTAPASKTGVDWILPASNLTLLYALPFDSSRVAPVQAGSFVVSVAQCLNAPQPSNPAWKCQPGPVIRSQSVASAKSSASSTVQQTRRLLQDNSLAPDDEEYLIQSQDALHIVASPDPYTAQPAVAALPGDEFSQGGIAFQLSLSVVNAANLSATFVSIFGVDDSPPLAYTSEDPTATGVCFDHRIVGQRFMR
jgi:hypothetical protein